MIRGLAKAKRLLNFPQYWQQSETGRQKKVNHSCCDKDCVRILEDSKK